MKNIILIRAFIVACFFNYSQVKPDPLITFFFRPYPEIVQDISHTKSNNLKRPGKIARTHTKLLIGNRRLISGIMVSYAGFLTVSDINGQVSLPKKQEKTVLYLAVTPKIIPIVRSGNTLSHWEFEEQTPVGFYKATKIEDKNIGLEYWDIQKENIPSDNVIPLETIIIVAHPEFIYIPEGATPTQKGPHFILPTIYVKKGINSIDNALYMLNLIHYFGPIQFEYKKGNNRYLEHIRY